MADNELGYDLQCASRCAPASSPTSSWAPICASTCAARCARRNDDFEIDFAFNIVDENAISARGGYEHFPDDEREGGNDIFLLAQWFPRLHAYTDYEGWTNKEFLGRGEFTLEFGDYVVDITVPDDHIVSSTGELQNPGDVLTRTQRERLETGAHAPMRRCSS